MAWQKNLSEENQFYVHLISAKDTKNGYGHNIPSYFTNVLPAPFDFRGEEKNWEVAVDDLQIPNTLYNVTSESRILLYYNSRLYPYSHIEPHLEKSDETICKKIILNPGFYDPVKLEEHINLQFEKVVEEAIAERETEIHDAIDAKTLLETRESLLREEYDPTTTPATKIGYSRKKAMIDKEIERFLSNRPIKQRRFSPNEKTLKKREKRKKEGFNKHRAIYEDYRNRRRKIDPNMDKNGFRTSHFAYRERYEKLMEDQKERFEQHYNLIKAALDEQSRNAQRDVTQEGFHHTFLKETGSSRSSPIPLEENTLIDYESIRQIHQLASESQQRQQQPPPPSTPSPPPPPTPPPTSTSPPISPPATAQHHPTNSPSVTPPIETTPPSTPSTPSTPSAQASDFFNWYRWDLALLFKKPSESVFIPPVLNREEDFNFKIIYEPETKKFKIELLENDEGLGFFEEDDYSQKLKQQLGYPQEDIRKTMNTSGYLSKSTCNLNKFLQRIYIYCNLVDYSMIGSQNAPIIRILEISQDLDKTFESLGSTLKSHSPGYIRPIIDRPQYYKVNGDLFKTITVSLHNEFGDLLEFQSTSEETILTLHFRKRERLKK